MSLLQLAGQRPGSRAQLDPAAEQTPGITRKLSGRGSFIVADGPAPCPSACGALGHAANTKGAGHAAQHGQPRFALLAWLCAMGRQGNARTQRAHRLHCAQ